MKWFERGGQAMGRAILVSAAILWPASALVAQGAPASNSAGSGAPADTVGPGELRDFSLGKKPVTEVAPAPTVQPDLIASPRRTPQRTTPAPERVVTAAPAPKPRPVPVVVPASPVVEAPQVATATAPAPHRPASTVTIALPPADPLARRPTPAGEADVPRLSSQPMGADAPLESSLAEDGMGGWLSWLVGLLVIAAGAGLAWVFRHRWTGVAQPQPALAGGPPVIPRDLPPRTFPPAPPPAPRIAEPTGGITVKRPNAFAEPRPAAAPATTTPNPGGIVSTRLRPWLDLSFEPSRAVIDEANANVTFDVVVTNSGNAPARQVLVEACMVNAGPEQDTELRRFFDAPVGAGDRIDAIPPLGKIQLKSAVSLPLAQVRAYEVGGRKLFVPLVAFNALYEWGSNAGQSSAAFILGRGSSAADGEADARMAPLRLDLGPRVFKELDSRRHSLGMRR